MNQRPHGLQHRRGIPVARPSPGPPPVDPPAPIKLDGVSKLALETGRTRLLVAGLSRVTERLETDGARFLFGERESEFKAQ